MNRLKDEVLKEKAEFGVAFDGDADRGVFIDDKGNELGGGKAGAVFINDILSNKKGRSWLQSIAPIASKEL